MLRTLRFPVLHPAWGDGNIAMTFETLAVPPAHAQVTAVCGWVYDGANLLTIHTAERGWELPGGARRTGETFHQTLVRTVWEDAGVHVGTTRLIGAFRTDNLVNDTAPTFMVVLVADVREAVPFGDAFDADDRAFVAPMELPHMIEGWNELMDEAFAFANAAHLPTPVESITPVESTIRIEYAVA